MNPVQGFRPTSPPPLKKKLQIELLAPPIILIWNKHFWFFLKSYSIPGLVISYDSRVIPPTRRFIWSERIIRHLHSHELASFRWLRHLFRLFSAFYIVWEPWAEISINLELDFGSSSFPAWEGLERKERGLRDEFAGAFEAKFAVFRVHARGICVGGFCGRFFCTQLICSIRRSARGSNLNKKRRERLWARDKAIERIIHRRVAGAPQG